MDERELLRSVPLFSELSDVDVASLARLASRRNYPKDTVARTAPPGGSDVTAGSTITIFISGGPQGGGGTCPPKQPDCPPR